MTLNSNPAWKNTNAQSASTVMIKKRVGLNANPLFNALEQRLIQNKFFMGETPSLLDYALLSFIRQFSRVNKPIFQQDQYANLRNWLSHHLQSQLFSKAMTKYPLWLDNREVCIFGE